MNTSAPVAGALPGRESVKGVMSLIAFARLSAITGLMESRGAGVNNGGQQRLCKLPVAQLVEQIVEWSAKSERHTLKLAGAAQVRVLSGAVHLNNMSDCGAVAPLRLGILSKCRLSALPGSCRTVCACILGKWVVTPVINADRWGSKSASRSKSKDTKGRECASSSNPEVNTTHHYQSALVS